MKVFVTGASGHVGSAVVPELLNAGHTVVGLARSERAAEALQTAGAAVWKGDLSDLDSLSAAAAEADGVIHLAYRHDLAFSGQPNGFLEAALVDLAAVKAMGQALVGTNKPFVITSGTAILSLHGEVRKVTEDDHLPRGPRVDCENWAIGLAEQGVRSGVVRLAPSVHSTLDQHGFLAMLVAIAKKNGFAAYVGDGQNVWNAVNTLDAASLYRQVLEKAPAGKRWHAVAEEAVPFRSIAEAIGTQLGTPVRSLNQEEATLYFGGFLNFSLMNCPASSAQTRTVLAWAPTHNTILEDLKLPHYFR